jgi:hypothetical protein
MSTAAPARARKPRARSKAKALDLKIFGEQIELELTPEPFVEVTEAPKKPPIKGLVALVALVVVAGFVAILTLNMATAQGAFTVALLEEEEATLAEREQSLMQQVALIESPGALATKAKALGMQPAEGGSYIRLEDGTLVGPGIPKSLKRPAAGVSLP